MLPLAAVALLLALLTLNRLGASDVCGGSEAAMAVFVQQMVSHHQLLFPLDNCTIPMYKPPLYHWTAAGLAALLGEDAATPFNLRLPSALYAFGAAILTMALAAKLLGRWGASLAGLILCGSYQYISQARIGLVDMTLTFCETLALYSFFYWFALADDAGTVRRSATHYLFAAALGLGVLAKGPVGALLPGIAVLLFLLIEREQPALMRLFRPGPLLVGAVLASSWYIACAIGRRYDFLNLQLGEENLGRFFGTLGAMPPWYYIRPLLLNSIPFSLFVPLAVIAALLPRRLAPHHSKVAGGALKRTDSREAPGSSALASSADSDTVANPARLTAASKLERRRQAARLLAMFWLVSVIFFDLAAYKRRAYLLPLWPASAFLLAWWTVEHLNPFSGERFGLLLRRAVIAICLVAAAANFAFIPAYELHGCGAPLTLASLFRWPSTGFAGQSSGESGQTESYSAAAARINRLTRPSVPLYSLGFDQALEPLIFYLRRCAPPLYHSIAVPPNARIIAPSRFWDRFGARYPNLSPLGNIPYDNDPLVLLGRSAVAGQAVVP